MSKHPIIDALDRCVAALKAVSATEPALKELVAEAVADLNGIKEDFVDLLDQAGAPRP